VRDVLTAKPDYMVMGMSAETFWGGADGNAAFTRRVEELSHLKVFTGAEACRAGCAQLGVRRIAVLTPYQPVADEQVERFFSDVGLDVVRVRGLRCPSATAIAEVDERELLGALRELDADDADAIVQVGTNLSMLRLADEAERWLGKPVIAVNAATLWHAMRSAGIADRLHGFGALLREH
jgi:maleate isomerase